MEKFFADHWGLSWTKAVVFICLSFVLWFSLHTYAILYGTAETPLHVSYWSADEQSPVNGALHMLKEKSLLGMRNENTLYYGPVFAVLALPAVVADFSVSYVFGGIRSADAYKDKVVWDWGGILVWARLLAVCTSLLGLVAVYLLFWTETLNPSAVSWIPYAAAGLTGISYFYFVHTSFFRHWVFVLVFLLWQLYLAVRLIEQDGRVWKLWLWQGVLAVASFGVSYLSLIYQVFWVPVLVYWVCRKHWTALRTTLLFAVGAAVGIGIVVWWHPYAFIRLLGLLGIIEPVAIGSVLGMTENTASGNSFLWYAWLVLIHTWPLLLAAIVLVIRNQAWHVLSSWWFWALLTPGAVNYVVFSMPPHHEARYMLPAIVLLVLVVFALVSRNLQSICEARKMKLLIVLLVGLWGVLNLVQIVGWTRMMAAGPVERSDIIPQILAWQEEKPDARTLVIKGWPLGYVHTQEAYEDYITRYDKEKYELWQYLRTLPPPQGVTPLDVYYLHEGEDVTDFVLRSYDHVVRHVPPQVGPDLVPESPQDEFDIRPWNVWRYQDYQERYEIVK